MRHESEDGHAGRLELTIGTAALPVDDAKYTVSLCGEKLFEVKSAAQVSGTHRLRNAIEVGAGDHELVVSGHGSSGTFERRFPLSVPKRQSRYSIGVVECHVEGDGGGSVASADDVGFTLQGTPDESTALRLGGGVCSVRG